MSAYLLALAATGLLAVIAWMDYKYPPLRSETISAGLTGPYHRWLDAAYVVLAAALIWRADTHAWAEIVAIITGLALIATAVTNTFHAWVDKLSGGNHSLWHSRFTTVVFVGGLLFEMMGNHGALWWLTGANVAIPLGVYLASRRSDYAEKAAVALMCFWLVVWSLM